MVFISYSSKDIEFVKFLVKLFKSNYIKTYCFALETNKAGNLINKIEKALDVSNAIIVVCSSNISGLTRSWVGKELNDFCTKHNEAKLIPLLLKKFDYKDLESIKPGLSQYYAIDFSDYRLYTGFKELLNEFDKELLVPNNRRTSTDRRRTKCRRSQKNRRVNSIRRLNQYIWKEWSTEYNLSENTYIKLNVCERYNFTKAIKNIFHYIQFFDKIHRQPIGREAIEDCISYVWDFFNDPANYEDNPIKATDISKAVSERIFEKYEIVFKDRREMKDRRRISDRRKADVIIFDDNILN